MNVQNFVEELNLDFYAGVPDSTLSALSDCLMQKWGQDPRHHLIAANEGNAAALAAGYHLATGKVAAVYLQNSGEGNIINPLLSLLSPQIYAIPALFIIGWRGEPGVKDEPQHSHQGMVTVELLKTCDVQYFVLTKETGLEEFRAELVNLHDRLVQGQQAAIIVKKGALTSDAKNKYGNKYTLTREAAIGAIIDVSGDDPIISTTGKASRELFELRESRGQDHSRDFLTVGSMGHASSIALAFAAQKPTKKIWCIDGDGAALMHLGSMAAAGAVRPSNMAHIIINNGAHESVGGMPTTAHKTNFAAVAQALGYPLCLRATNESELSAALQRVKNENRLCLLEIMCAIGARSNLGRPTTTPGENKLEFMEKMGV